MELKDRDIPFVPQVDLKIMYKNRELRQSYKPDLICFDKIIVELKSVAKINDQHKGQTTNYLKATGMKLGIIVNFGFFPKAEICRLAL